MDICRSDYAHPESSATPRLVWVFSGDCPEYHDVNIRFGEPSTGVE